MKISFFIPGEPVAQGRSRMTTGKKTKIVNGKKVVIKQAGKPRMYDAPKSAAYKNMVSMVASQKMLDKKLIEEAVSVIITVQKSIPRSWSKKKQAKAIEGSVRPIGRPDIDNYIKAVFDGLNGVVFKDDSQVTFIGATKQYSTTPGVSVVIFDENELEGNQ